MNKLYTLAGLMGGTFVMFSFSTNPPDGNTGAPGDDLCVQCHIQSNPPQNGTITVEGFPATITPNETYMLTAVNRVTAGTAVRAGFQVTILGPFNTRAGDLTNPSASSAVSISGGRQYWDHSPALLYPDSNVVRWNVLWKAPNSVAGSQITWYAAGNIADGNFSNLGDRIVTASGSGVIMLSATDDMVDSKPLIFPNPGNDVINIEISNETMQNGIISFYNFLGEKIRTSEIIQGVADASCIPQGVYLIEIKNDDQSHFVRWSKF